MHDYKIEQMQVYLRTYQVQAASEAEAVIKVFDGEAGSADDSVELIDLCDERGLCAADHPDLADELRKAGIMTDQVVIPSIRSIEKVESDVQQSSTRQSSGIVVRSNG
jgi:isocitrate lyase